MREASAHSGRVDAHVLRDWCWIGTARDDGELGSLLEAPPRPSFDFDVARLLIRRWSKAALRLDAAPHAGSYEDFTTS